MTKSSIKNKEINGSLPDHSAVTDPTQNQTAITNEQPRIENEVSKAVTAANNRQQERNCCEKWEKVICVSIVLTFLFVKKGWFYLFL